MKTKKIGNAEAIKGYRFKPGQSGNPAGARRTKPLDLPKSYQKELAKIDPVSGRSNAELIAEQIVARAVSGDVQALMLTLSNDHQDLVKKAVDKIAKEEGCSRRQARLALSLFIPQGLIP